MKITINQNLHKLNLATAMNDATLVDFMEE
jgi:hypothetical protein